MPGVERTELWNSAVSVGLGYVAIPFGVDRDKFVSSCYRKERVHVAIERGSLVKNCYIDSDTIQKIKFPKTCEQLGSQIVFVMEKYKKIPIVIACLTRNQERIIADEESINIQKSYKGGLLSIVGKGDGSLLISLEGVDTAKMIIHLTGANSVLDVNSDGTITLNAKDEVTINSSSQIVKNHLNDQGLIEKSLTLDDIGLRYKDDKGNEFFIDYNNNKIVHNQGSQPIPLGTELKTQLDKLNKKFNTFVDAFTSGLIIPGDGGAALKVSVAAAVSTLKDADFDKINSEKSFID
jgi:hypothetical protein